MRVLNIFKNIIIFVIMLILTIVIQINQAFLISKSTNIIGLIIVFSIILMLLLKLMKIWKLELASSPFKVKDIWLILGAAIVSEVTSMSLSYVGLLIHSEQASSNRLISERMLSTNMWVVLIAVMSVIFMGPILEEIVIRGMIYQFISKNSSIMIGYILTATIFAYLHDGWSFSFIIYFIDSLILTYVFQHTGNIYSSIACHQFMNVLTTLQLFITFFIFI
ncbi:CPBP family intramembrane glutamic endopeptidase [Companilactobacillus jidongensis]|uniref:CPBP family intramembrane glutamic endopeptidase n=1 Tax=Companilactobacillus jidongensis TaxID=2486006 RepID=UPI000F76C5AE|nr:type II CAAX endopeptidase family protein [Companilactobacillus jidongensis]